MRANVAAKDQLSQSRESAQWVLSRDYFSEGFHFSLCQFEESSQILQTGQQVLAGNGLLKLGLSNGTEKQSANFRYIEDEDFLIGIAQKAVQPESLEGASFELYQELLEIASDRSICRIWNYVPGINETHPGLIENYKLFCSGRSKAFEAVFGEETPWHLPSASATGTKSDLLTIVFVATRSPVENWENPEQTPAYLYPAEYGPSAPSFARASRFTMANGKEWIFVSGTASIKGSDSQHKGVFQKQLDVTLENIDLILQKCGLQLAGRDPGRKRCFKVFLRNKDDLEELLKRMEDVIGPEDSLAVVEGDICRSNLEVEIELTVIPA